MLTAAPTYAQTPESAANAAPAKRSDGSMRAVVVVDDPDSGAMTRQLTLSAAMLFASMANPKDELGLFVAGKPAVQLPPEPLSMSETFSGIRKALDGLETAEAAPFGTAWAFASRSLVDNRKAKPALVILAHGARDASAVPKIPPGLAAQMAKAKVPAYVVAFGAKVKAESYRDLTEKSGGEIFKVAKGADLKRAFNNILTALHDTEALPVVGDAVVMDDGINGATMVVPKKSKKDRIRIVTPGERVLSAKTKYPGVKWTTFAEYDLIRIENPEPGTWRVRQPSKLGGVVGRVDGGSVRLDVKVAPRKPMVGASFHIEAHLEKEGRRLDSYALMKHLVMEAEIQDPSGRVRPVRLNRGENGFFTAKVENELQGYHEVRLTAFSPELRRERRVTYLVNPACFSGKFDKKKREVIVDRSQTCPGFAELYVQLHVKREGELIFRRNFKKRGRQLYVPVPAPELGHEHELIVDIVAKTMDGHPVQSDGGGPYVDAAREPTWVDYLAAVGKRLLVINVPVIVGLLGLVGVRQARRRKEPVEAQED